MSDVDLFVSAENIGANMRQHFAIAIILISVNYGEFSINDFHYRQREESNYSLNLPIVKVSNSSTLIIRFPAKERERKAFGSNYIQSVYHSKLATDIFHARETFLSPSSAFSSLPCLPHFSKKKE